MRRRYSQRSDASLLDRIFNRFTWKYWILGGAALIILLTGISIYKSNQKLTPADTALYGEQQIVVGIAADVANFGTADASGQPTGLDRDVATALLSSLYPDSEIFFVEIESQQASYLLREGKIDLALGMFPKDVLRTQGLSVTQPYFTDGVYAYVNPGSSITDLSGLGGKRLSVMTSEVSKSTVQSALKDRQLEADLVSCTSYPDGIYGVQRGSSKAIIAPACKMIPYKEDLRRLDTPVCTVGYCILSWKNQGNMTSLLNERIAAMQEEGEIDLLAAKWGVEQTILEK
ncbi:MAG: transporter substrate-binding domain-containing protein [Christensenellaceae bacterium]|nr:transporter substrate-binding domain-containing protein [Christensenellaceae bacterium]